MMISRVFGIAFTITFISLISQQEGICQLNGSLRISGGVSFPLGKFQHTGESLGLEKGAAKRGFYLSFEVTPAITHGFRIALACIYTKHPISPNSIDHPLTKAFFDSSSIYTHPANPTIQAELLNTVWLFVGPRFVDSLHPFDDAYIQLLIGGAFSRYPRITGELAARGLPRKVFEQASVTTTSFAAGVSFGATFLEHVTGAFNILYTTPTYVATVRIPNDALERRGTQQTIQFQFGLGLAI